MEALQAPQSTVSLSSIPPFNQLLTPAPRSPKAGRALVVYSRRRPRRCVQLDGPASEAHSLPGPPLLPDSVQHLTSPRAEQAEEGETAVVEHTAKATPLPMRVAAEEGEAAAAAPNVGVFKEAFINTVATTEQMEGTQTTGVAVPRETPLAIEQPMTRREAFISKLAQHTACILAAPNSFKRNRKTQPAGDTPRRSC